MATRQALCSGSRTRLGRGANAHRHGCRSAIHRVAPERKIEGRFMIFETIVTTQDDSGRDHIAPMGIRHEGEFIVLSPFRPSATLEHVLREKCAVVNYTDDVR